MRHYDQRRSQIGSPAASAAGFVIGERVSIIGAPASYGYNGCVGTVIAIDGVQIRVQVDNPPGDMACTTFYCEELTHMGVVQSGNGGSQL